MRRISLILICVMLVCMFPVDAAKEQEYDIGTQTFTPLDLTKVANMGFADEKADDGKGGWTDQGPENDFSSFTYRGRTLFNAIPFDIIDPLQNNGNSCIVLRGQNNQFFPTSAEIEVNQKAGGVYFLHDAGWLAPIVGTYTFVYDDGTSYDVNIRGDVDVFNWWGRGSSDKCIPIWTGANGSTSQISLGLFACPNPYPDKIISKIVASTPGDGAYLMLVAATLTDEKPYLPFPPDTANPVSTSNWYPYKLPNVEDVKGTIMDMSYLLDAPAGKHGFIHAENDKMFFEDGTPFRFWGINLNGQMLFVSHRESEMIADWIAVQGFNLVRIHQMDGNNSNYSNAFGRVPKSSTQLDEEQMDKLCYLLNELKKRGIYWFIDNAATRPTFEDDNIQDYSIVDAAQKGFDAYDPIIQKLHRDYSTQLFNWYNPYTKLRIKDDPALVCTDLVNENILFDQKTPDSEYYANQLDTLLTSWLKDKYKTDAAVAKAWTQTGRTGVPEGENFENGYHYRALAETKGSSDQRREDMRMFAVDVQTKYIDETYEYFKKDLNVKALVAGSNDWTNLETSVLRMNAATDFVDIHKYWSHPVSGWSVSTGYKFDENWSMLEDDRMGILGPLMNSQVYNRVHTVSEWNDCEPNSASAEGLLLMAAYSRLHNFNPIAFTFSVHDEWKDIIKSPEDYTLGETLSFFGKPVKMAGAPSAAFIALSDAVKEADEGYYTLYRKEDVSEIEKRFASRDPWIGLIGKSGLAFEEQYDADYNSNEILKLADEGRKTGVYTSVTGELTADKNKAIFVLNTELAQAASGYLSGDRIETNDVIFDIDTEFAVNSLIAVDKQPIEKSERMLLTTLARNRNTGMKLARDFVTVSEGGTSPIIVEPVEGEIIIKNRNEYDVWTLTSAGQRGEKIQTERTPEGYTKILLTADNQTMNYELVRTKQAEKAIADKQATYRLQDRTEDVFTDIYDEKTKQATERLYILGAIRGTDEKTFSPNQNITREEFALWLMKALNPVPAEDIKFKDVPENSVVNKLRSMGVINDELLRASDYLRTEDMYSIIEGTLKAIGREKTTVPREFNGDLVTRGAAAEVIFDVLWKL